MDGLDNKDTQDGQLSDKMAQFGDHVDKGTFSQILEMDEEGHDFSKPLVVGFFDQATETFLRIENALKASDLNELSSLGHFLKGSSATLGFTKIQENCQIIQQYGHRLTTESTPENDEEVCLKKISEALEKAKVDTNELQNRMVDFFGLLDSDIH